MLSNRSSNSLFLLGYIALLVYGSLYPLAGWRIPEGSPMVSWPRYVSRADMVTNLLVYIPLGLLLVRSFPGRWRAVSSIAMATVLGSVLSIGVEVLQLFLPARVSSMGDIALNAAGSLIGAVIAWNLKEQVTMGRQIRSLRHAWFLSGAATDAGLAAIGLWALSQLVPLVPSFDVGNLKQGLRPLWYTLRDPAIFRPLDAAVYAFSIGGLGVIATIISREKKFAPVFWGMFAATVLLLKVPIVGRQLSLEAISGLVVGLALLFFARKLPSRLPVAAASLMVLGGFIVSELSPASNAAATYPFNWVPFAGHMTNVMGLAGILEGIWPFTALAFLTWEMHTSQSLIATTTGGVFLLALVFALEWSQQSISGRHGDITAPVLAGIGWILPRLRMARENR